MISSNYSCLINICLQAILEFQVFLSNIYNFKTSIWSIDGTHSGTTTPVQSRLRSNANKGVLHTLQCSRNGALSPDVVQDTNEGILLLCWYILHSTYRTSMLPSLNCDHMSKLTSWGSSLLSKRIRGSAKTYQTVHGWFGGKTTFTQNSR